MKTLRDVGVGGERAVTHWKSLKVKDGCTLLRIHLETGRTHQIRVHFKSLGAPLVGDDMYGSTDKKTQPSGTALLFRPLYTPRYRENYGIYRTYAGRYE